MRDAIGREWTEGRRHPCPWCAGSWALAETSADTYGVVHTLPICDTYKSMDATDYYAEASKRIAS